MWKSASLIYKWFFVRIYSALVCYINKNMQHFPTNSLRNSMNTLKWITREQLTRTNTCRFWFMLLYKRFTCLMSVHILYNIAESIQSQVVAAYKTFHCVGFVAWYGIVRTHTVLPVQRKRKTASVTSLSNKITSFWTYADTIFVY